MDEALLYRRLTTLRLDVPLEEGVGDLEWRGAEDGFGQICEDLGVPNLPDLLP